MQADLKPQQQDQVDPAPAQQQAQQGGQDQKPADPAGLSDTSLVLTDAQLKEAVEFNKSQGLKPDQIKLYQRLVGAPSDGAIGPTTTKAVHAYQLCHANLKPDGKLGPMTRAALEADYQARQNRDPGPAQELTEAQILSAIDYNKGRYEDADIVKQIQIKVGAKEDGDFGPDTIKAIWSWQAANGLKADGRVGPTTIERMGVGIHSEEHKQQGNKEHTNEADIPQGNVTANIAWSEFNSRGDGKPVPPELRDNVRALCEQLEVIREAFGGRAIVINSGYRSPWWNSQVGGAKNSQHKMGTACDFNIAGVRPATVRQKVEELIKAGKVKQGGLGAYAGFTHYDIRGYRARW